MHKGKIAQYQFLHDGKYERPRQSLPKTMQHPRAQQMERGNLLIEAEASEPAISKVHPNVFDQTAFTGDSLQVSDQHNAAQDFRIDSMNDLCGCKSP